MAQQTPEQTIPDVPTFTLSLKDLQPCAAVPQLFVTPPPAENKRKPGFLTTVRKTTVSHLLQVFRPENQGLCEEFAIKKKLVTNAIHAIYEHRKGQQQKQKATIGVGQAFKSKQFQRSPTASLYHTPKKSKNYEESITETTKRSLSQSKLNYSRYESKFNGEDINRLRKRAGAK